MIQVNELVKISDEINHQVNKILFDDFKEPQIILIENKHPTLQGSQEKGVIKIWVLEHDNLNDFFNTLIHELTHYYLNYDLDIEGVYEKEHSENFNRIYNSILEEPFIYKILNKYKEVVK